MRASIEAQIPNQEYLTNVAASGGTPTTPQLITYPNTNQDQILILTSLGCDTVVAIGPENNIAANNTFSGQQRAAATNSTRRQFTCKDGAIYKFKASYNVHQYFSVISSSASTGTFTLNVA